MIRLELLVMKCSLTFPAQQNLQIPEESSYWSYEQALTIGRLVLSSDSKWTPKRWSFWSFVRGKASKSFGNMVARDGIEPPTPAFSGVAAVMLICLISLALFIFNTLKTAHLLEQ